MLNNPIRFVACVLLWLLQPGLSNSGHTWGQTPTHEVPLGQTKFTIPLDMNLELVADEELTTWPILADWDLQGRLLVVESGGVSKPIEEHNKQLLHRIVRLDDSDGDGRFDQRTVVAKDLPFTEGVLCIGDDLLVTAPPSIYRLIDADQDGLFEAREVWFDGQTITGCANDLHGPYLGRDGWIYWCKGAFAEQRHQLLGGKKLVSSAAHVFRRRLSGGDIEPVMTGGMDNPVEIAITPEGERFFTSTFLHSPGQYPGLRDGIAHAVYGGLYGKDHTKVIAGHTRTGDLMPVMVELGAAAPSGLACLSSNHLLPAVQVGQRTLVVAQFNMQKVTAVRLLPQGASFTTDNLDLVVADRIDFHPTDVLEDSDGSLLIVDTGGWYDLCCPSSRVDQKTAAGGIYRLSSKATASHSKNPRANIANDGQSAALAPAQLARQLLDGRPWVSRDAHLQLLQLQPSRAADNLPASDSGSTGKVVSELQRQMRDTSLSLDDRLDSLWGLCTLGDSQALAAITEQLGDPNEALLQAACHAVSLHRVVTAKPQLEQLLAHQSLHVRRAAAEGLGRIGDSQSAIKLLSSFHGGHTADRHWQHSVTYALIELSAIDQSLACLASQDPVTAKNVALLVLDQLGAAEQLTVEMLLDGLNSSDERYRLSSSQILAKHPQWAPNYRAKISVLFSELGSSTPASDPLKTLVTGWRDTATVKELMAESISNAINSLPGNPEQLKLIDLLAAYENTDTPASWSGPLSQWLNLAQGTVASRLTETLARLKFPAADKLSQTLITKAEAASDPISRLQFLSALPVGSTLNNRELEHSIVSGLSAAEFGEPANDDDQAMRDSLSSDVSAPSASSLALEALQRVQLSLETGQQLLASLSRQSPRRLPIVIEAINRVGNDQLDRDLLNQLRELPAARTLAEEQLLNLYRSRSSELRRAAADTIASLSRPPADVQAKIDSVLAQLKPGDPIRGLQLFRSNKTACSGCHQLGYVGGEIGPNLTHIGSSRTREALLEAILFPNARLEQSYQPTKVLTHDGQVFNGLVTQHMSPTQFKMQLTADKSVVLSTDDVARQEASQVSIMPSGIVELLTQEELSDLLAILESAK